MLSQHAASVAHVARGALHREGPGGCGIMQQRGARQLQWRSASHANGMVEAPCEHLAQHGPARVHHCGSVQRNPGDDLPREAQMLEGEESRSIVATAEKCVLGGKQSFTSAMTAVKTPRALYLAEPSCSKQ